MKLKNLFTLLILFFLTSCSFPQDPKHTLKKIKNGVMTVGFCDFPPWVKQGSPPSGIEPSIIFLLAKQLNTKVKWIYGSEGQLFNLLEKNKINIIICGISDESPWKNRVAFSRVYTENTHSKHRKIMAILKGENAWLSFIDKFIMDQQRNINGIIQNYAYHKN